jgi:ankyrin repeat domain-containing protein 50
MLTRSSRSIVIKGVEKSASEEQGSTICIGYIYLRYSDSLGLTVRQCLEILVKQTVEKHPACLRLAESVYAEHIRLKTRPTEEELLQLLKDCVIVVKAFYFLDALDEAPLDIQASLVEKLSSTGAKLFITSRPMTTLQDRFPDAHHFAIAAQEYDIGLLINERLNRSHELDKVLEQGGAALRAHIESSIKQNCRGM